MASDVRSRKAIRRLHANLSLAWTVAWIAGIATLSGVAANLSAELRQRDLDSELALHATAVYGLTWFEGAEFRDEALRAEPDLIDSPYDIWVVEPGEPPIIHLAPQAPIFELDIPGEIARQVVEDLEERFLDGNDSNDTPFRLHGIPTYDENVVDVARAAILVVGNPLPGLAAHGSFLRGLAAVAAAVGILGIGLGISLARWTLRPVADSLLQREHFISAAAHELRTPVAALRGVCESALAGDESPEVALRRTASLIGKTERLVENLLMFARLDAGSAKPVREKVRLDLLVEASLSDHDEVRFEGEETVVEADPNLLTVAVRNLLENARRHGGRKDRNLTVKVTSGRVIIEDGGPGFPSDILPILRQDFALAPSPAGTGLGLAIVKKIAELHGGSLAIENLEPKGARATLRIPVRKFS